MRSSSELNCEPNFMAQYMSSSARAGVILNPVFSSLDSERDICMLRSTNTLHHVRSFENVANSYVSEDSFEEVDVTYRDSSAASNNSDQLTSVSVALNGSMLTSKNPVVEWDQNRISPCFREDDLEREDSNDPLFKKLEQLKALQQLKQEQLKRQQMEQLQKLMEEQKMLLNLVSRQPAFPELDQQNQPVGLNRSTSPKTNLYIDSPFGKNSPVEHLHDQNNSSMLCSQTEQSIQARPNDRPSACVQEFYTDAAEKRNNPERDGPSPGGDAGNYVCDNDKTEESTHYEDSLKSSQEDENSSLPTGNSIETCDTEERPILSGMKERKKSFEELLEEQMRLEEQRLKQNDQQQASEQTKHKHVVKQPFLRRGEGLARFRNGKTFTITKECNSKPEVLNTAKIEKTQIQRKIAPVVKEQNVENVISKKSIPNSKEKIEPQLPNKKKLVFKNHNTKNISSATMLRQMDNKPAGNVKSSVTEDKLLETNKENVIPSEASQLLKKRTGKQNGSSGSNIKASPNAVNQFTELSFEASFQKRQIHWEKEKQLEHFELDEFLLLEQAAEDISFSSNSSFIQKLLNQDYQVANGHGRLSSTPVKMASQTKIVGDGDVNVKKQNKSWQKEMGVGSSISFEKQYEKDIYEKPQSIVIDGKKSKLTELVTSEEDSSESEDEHNVTVTSINTDLDNREDDLVSEDCKKPSKNLNVDRSRDFDLDLSDGESCTNESTVVESKEILVKENHNLSFSNTSEDEFDDEKTWDDLGDIRNQVEFSENKQNGALKEFIPSDYTSPVSVPDKTITRKVASKKTDELLSVSVKPSSPPASDLMMKLFPSLKPKQKPEPQLANKSVPVQDDPDVARSQLLREKLVELESEIERFKMENATLARLREDQEKSLEKLKKEVADFEQQKSKELARIEEYKKEELRKLQKERKVFEKYASAARAIPDKKEREEIQVLKQQVTDLQEELKRKEGKWSNNHGRLRNQIETLTKENAELREEIKFMEKVRLETWKKAEAVESSRKMAPCQEKQPRSDTISPPSTSRKTQNPCPSQQEKTAKQILRSQSPVKLKGKASKDFKQNQSCDLNKSEKTKVNKTEYKGSSLPQSSEEIPIEPKNQMNVVKGTDDDVQGEISYSDGKVERILRNGCHVILFPNGTRKEVSADGKTTTVTFFNGDIKQVMADKRVIYYYADAQTTHTTYPDGLEILQFSNGQIEKHFPDGKKEITFPDQTIKNLYTDGREESIFPDGTIITLQPDGSKLIEFDNGQRELHTAQFKRREYPDGTIKTVYSNGQQETKYASGRIRVKDKDGNIIMDTKT
ncbi:centromere protein J [Bombina bombina]|uniref:centromere protein J n=1 Tax=Bombina bombina TaxID=8345 RepID=UPI00235A5427|nr:centromere protein J [Bombina bombina]